MANLFDYLDWRDDLRLSQDPLNEVDCMILSRMSYLPFEDLGAEVLGTGITVRDAAREVLQLPDLADHMILRDDERLASRLAQSVRFGDMKLTACREYIDQQTQTQFWGATVELGDGRHMVIFRGTDNTLVGWKEDFNMSFACPVPAQTIAVEYVNRVCAAIPGPLLLCGHSKGGNLAVYAGVFAAPQIRDRIGVIYNFDGPGFQQSVIDTPEYRAVCDRIISYVPQSSVVGMLLEHEEKYTIVHSREAIQIMQHDTYSWEVERNRFRYVETVTSSSRFVDATVKAWLSSVSVEQREKFVDAVYTVLSGTNVRTFKDMRENWFDSARALAKAIHTMDPQTREIVVATVGKLLECTREELGDTIRGKAE